jgi:citrate synthase
MTATAFWEQRRARIRTRKGGWRIGQGVSVHGHSLLDELLGRHGYVEVLYLEVVGELPEPRLARWIEASFLCLSFPDPRIWCNQVGALAGSSRVAPVPGIAAGVMASDSAVYGPGSTRAACELLGGLRRAIDGGETIAAWIARHTTRGGRLRAPGFSRPVVRGDDRVGALAGFAAELGFADGPWLDLAWRLDAELRAQGNDALNMLGYVAAFLLDRGMRIEDGERLYALAVAAGVHACYAEAADEPAGGFLPLALADVEYTGVAPRPLPGGGAAR